jgi:hypothetical protein
VVTEGELLKDAVAEEAEACSSVHLSFEQFGLGVDAFGAAVVVSAGQGCVDVRQVRLFRGVDPFL